MRYKKAQSMVYCGIFPAEGEKYENVKDALEKLQVNDAAFNFEPENSAALGYGYRCGFLGLLHMDVITERLAREFDLDVITPEGIPLPRSAINRPPRQCLLCQQEARFCMRNHTHTREELQQRIDEMVTEFMREKK